MIQFFAGKALDDGAVAMMTKHPRRTTQYIMGIVDTSRWDQFSHRPDDVFVCTPPKCGTTWTQAICAMLVQGTPDFEGSLTEVSPWLDCVHPPLEEVLSGLEAQTHRRVIKTHTPLDGIPFFPECTYIAVYRDPRDACLSGQSHGQNLLMTRENTTQDPEEFFLNWIRTDGKDFEEMPLQGLVHHFRTFHEFKHLDQLVLIHYADMLRDLREIVSRLAKLLKVDHDGDVLDAIAHAASFASMKSAYSKFVPAGGRGAWEEESRFFNKGSQGQWKDTLSRDVLERYDEVMRAALPETDVAWLQYGETASA